MRVLQTVLSILTLVTSTSAFAMNSCEAEFSRNGTAVTVTKRLLGFDNGALRLTGSLANPSPDPAARDNEVVMRELPNGNLQVTVQTRGYQAKAIDLGGGMVIPAFGQATSIIVSAESSAEKIGDAAMIKANGKMMVISVMQSLQFANTNMVSLGITNAKGQTMAAYVASSRTY